jgi:hypothetical protein
MAATGATIKSTLFHPEHPLKRYNYGKASSYFCNACELMVTGTGYSCGGCDFDIHESCLGLPGFMSASDMRHSHLHGLTLVRLRASRYCDVCRETSRAGSYMYLCPPCNYDVHPRCVTSLVAHAHRGRPRRSTLDETLHHLPHVVHGAHAVMEVVASSGACTIM